MVCLKPMNRSWAANTTRARREVVPGIDHHMRDKVQSSPRAHRGSCSCQRRRSSSCHRITVSCAHSVIGAPYDSNVSVGAYHWILLAAACHRACASTNTFSASCLLVIPQMCIERCCHRLPPLCLPCPPIIQPLNAPLSFPSSPSLVPAS